MYLNYLKNVSKVGVRNWDYSRSRSSRTDRSHLQEWCLGWVTGGQPLQEEESCFAHYLGITAWSSTESKGWWKVIARWDTTIGSIDTSSIIDPISSGSWCRLDIFINVATKRRPTDSITLVEFPNWLERHGVKYSLLNFDEWFRCIWRYIRAVNSSLHASWYARYWV